MEFDPAKAYGDDGREDTVGKLDQVPNAAVVRRRAVQNLPEGTTFANERLLEATNW
jgi:hypothetical protein